MHILRRTFCVLLLAAAAVDAPAAAGKWPAQPLRIVVPTAAGGPNDLAARAIAEAMETELGQPLLVENRVGASGTIAAAYVAKAPADGYTLFFGTSSTLVIAPAMTTSVPYDPIQDFSPIGTVGSLPFAIFVRATLPVKTLPELIALARSENEKLTFGTTGPAAVYELAALTLESQAKVKFLHVAYKGFAPMVLDVSGQHVDVGVGPIDNSLKSDRLRILAVLGSQRSAQLPDVPASSEVGYPFLTLPTWASLMAPAGTPPAVVDQISVAMQAAMAREDVQARLVSVGLLPSYKGERALARQLAEDLDTVRTVMRQTGVAPSSER